MVWKEYRTQTIDGYPSSSLFGGEDFPNNTEF